MENKIDRQKFVDHINKKWKGGISCPVCKENDWIINDHLLELRVFNQGSFVVGGPLIPIASITCNNCGYIMHFNAIKIGLLEPENQDKEK